MTHVVTGNDGETSKGTLHHYFAIGTEVVEAEDENTDESVGFYVAKSGHGQYIARSNVESI